MMSNARRNRLAPSAALLLGVTLALSACSTGDMLSESLGGLPADAPQRPTTTLPTPNVYEVRPTRAAAPLSDDEQKKLESDLVTLRESQKQRANPPPPPPPPPPPRKAAAAEKKKAAGSEKKAVAKDPLIPAAKKPAGTMNLIN
jgi:hypothetical protein